MEKIFQFSILALSGIIRLIPHVSNFTPILSAVTYSYVSIKNSIWSTISILITLYLTDLFLHFVNPEIHPLYGWWIVYIYPIHILNGFISKFMIHKPNQVVNIGVCCTLTSFSFFMLSNFGKFLFTESDLSMSNLKKIYLDAIPFYPTEMFSNYLYSALFFAMHCIFFRENTNAVDDFSLMRGNSQISQGSSDNFSKDKKQTV